MTNCATAWTDLERALTADPTGWPTYICPAGHENAITPFSCLWDKSTGRLRSCPDCFICAKEKRALQEAQRAIRNGRKPESLPRHFPDRETALRDHGVPSRLARQPFLGKLPRVQGQVLATWTGSPALWAVILHGTSSAGKSMLAAELLWQRLPHIHTAAWWRASDLLDALFGALGEESQTRAHQARTVDLLVIDDLGRGMGNRGLDHLFNLLATRHDNDRATLLTFKQTLLTFCELHPTIAPTLTTDTLAIPFTKTYKERTKETRQSTGSHP